MIRVRQVLGVSIDCTACGTVRGCLFSYGEILTQVLVESMECHNLFQEERHIQLCSRPTGSCSLLRLDKNRTRVTLLIIEHFCILGQKLQFLLLIVSARLAYDKNLPIRNTQHAMFKRNCTTSEKCLTQMICMQLRVYLKCNFLVRSARCLLANNQPLSIYRTHQLHFHISPHRGSVVLHWYQVYHSGRSLLWYPEGCGGAALPEQYYS